MKFTATALTLAGLTAMVSALPQASETGGNTAGPTVTAPPQSSVSVYVDPVYSSVLACISGCTPGDVYCQAQCQGLPTPDETAVNATHDCVAACPPGGDDEKNAAWAVCQQKCVTELYWTASVPYTGGVTLPTGESSAADGDANPTATGSDGAEETGAEQTGSETSGGPGPSSTPNAAPSVFVSMPLLGAFGLFLGALAL